MLSTQTRSSRDAICISELIPTWYLKAATPRGWRRAGMISRTSGRDSLVEAETGGETRSPARFHPDVGLLGVLNDFADVGVETEQAIRQAERIAGVAQGAHAAHQVRA